MTSTRAPEDVPTRVAVIGTGLIGTSVALAAARTGIAVSGWDADTAVVDRAAAASGLEPASSLEDAVGGAELVIVATPIPTVASLVAAALAAEPDAVVTDAASVKGPVAAEVAALVGPTVASRFVPGHPMGGSERSGPEHASASVVDGIVWAVTPSESTSVSAVSLVDGFIRAVGARPVELTTDRHDRLVAFVSHLPQVASTSLMDLAASEEADEPEILLLAAGGFRDLTRLAASDPHLWSDILLSNSGQIVQAIDLYIERLRDLRARIDGGAGDMVQSTFSRAKTARLRLAAKPQIRAGVAVLQIEIPDEPGALARITAATGDGDVNIEDLQIVHSAEGGRGTVHLTVAGQSVETATRVLVQHGFDPIRLA